MLRRLLLFLLADHSDMALARFIARPYYLPLIATSLLGCQCKWSPPAACAA